jgi:aspartate racemase
MCTKSKTLGIIGGLGPAASVRFCELLTKMTVADRDQDHIDLVLFSRASIPDRTAFLTGASGESPLPAILEVVAALNGLGVDYIAMPCVTAHAFMAEIREASRVPVISMIEETVGYLQGIGAKSAAILATDGTIRSRIFQDALESAGIAAVIPDADKQSEVMAAINTIKSGQVAALTPLANADVNLLACTELSLLESSNAKDSGSAASAEDKPRSGVCPEFKDSGSAASAEDKPRSGVCPEFTDCLQILARKAIALCSRISHNT